MGIKHHLLALAHIRHHQKQSAMAQPYMRQLDRGRLSTEHDRFMAPVKLKRIPRIKTQWYVRLDNFLMLYPPGFHIPTHRVVTASIAFLLQSLVYTWAQRRRLTGNS